MKNKIIILSVFVLAVCSLCIFGDAIIYNKIDGSIIRKDSEFIKWNDSYIGGKTIIDNPNWNVIDVGYGTNLSHTVFETNVYDVIENVLDENGNLSVGDDGNPFEVTRVETNVYERTIIHTNISEISDFRTKEKFINDLKSPELKATELELFSWLEENGLVGVEAKTLPTGTDSMIMMWLRAHALDTNGTQLLVQYFDLKASIEGFGGTVNKASR
jgi:hypothetical protein